MLHRISAPEPAVRRGGAEDRGATRLTGRVVPREDVSGTLADHLYELFGRYYRAVDRDTFDRDQAEKDWVLLLADQGGTVRGFTTLKRYDLTVDGRRLSAVFSGNTIIQRDFWGEQELVWTWCRFMAGLKRQAPAVPLHWFLVCSGYRTYLYLPLFFHDFFPRYDRPTPEPERRLIDSLGRMKYPDEYRDGVVRVARPRECLLPELAVPEQHKLRNSHVAFFFARNPGCLRGDELVCVTEFSVANTKRLAHQLAGDTVERAGGP